MGKKEKRDQRYRESTTESEPVVKETEYGKRIYSGFHFDWLIDRYEMASCPVHTLQPYLFLSVLVFGWANFFASVCSFHVS